MTKHTNSQKKQSRFTENKGRRLCFFSEVLGWGNIICISMCQCGKKTSAIFLCLADVKTNITDKKQMKTVLRNLDVGKCHLGSSGWLVRVMCCSVCDGVLWACPWTDCDRKQFVCWIDGSGDVEQSDEIMSVSPPPARSQHPSRPKKTISITFCLSLPVIFSALFASIFSVRP